MFRWVYIIEGLFSVVCALLIWFGLPNDPANAYFLTDEEKWMMRVRNEQRRHYMGSEHFTWDEMWLALRDPKLAFSAVVQFCQDILLYGFSTFLPTILQSIGYDSLMSNVLTVPVYIWAAIVFVILAFMADRYSKFAVVGVLFLLLWLSYANQHSSSSGVTSSASSVTSSSCPFPTIPSNTSPPTSAVSRPTPVWDSTSPG